MQKLRPVVAHFASESLAHFAREPLAHLGENLWAIIARELTPVGSRRPAGERSGELAAGGRGPVALREQNWQADGRQRCTAAGLQSGMVGRDRSEDNAPYFAAHLRHPGAATRRRVGNVGPAAGPREHHHHGALLAPG